MWRWYVEVGFLVLLCFGAGAGVAAVVLARLLPAPTEASHPTGAAADPGAPGSPS